MNKPECLLDTHVLLWLLTDPDRLSALALDVVEDPDSQLHVSAASAWEIATKHRLGKLPGVEGVLRSYRRHLRRADVAEVAMSAEHALLAGDLSWERRDPFDRMIAATAMVEGLVVVTADRAFTGLAGVRVIW